MCLGIPMKVVENNGDTGVVEVGGLRRKVSLLLLKGVNIGDYVVVHAGFAIQVLDENEARETLSLFNKISEAYKDEIS